MKSVGPLVSRLQKFLDGSVGHWGLRCPEMKLVLWFMFRDPDIVPVQLSTGDAMSLLDHPSGVRASRLGISVQDRTQSNTGG